MTPSDDTKKESLYVEWVDGALRFSFTGLWSGKHISTVVRLLPREYHLYMRGLRRTPNPEPVVAQEAINER